MEKLCMFCDHFGWNAIDYTYYSTLTGGSMEGGLTCAARQMNKLYAKALGWDWEPYSELRPDDTDEFRMIIKLAEVCPDYSPPASKP
jgi:hypothetical protein